MKKVILSLAVVALGFTATSCKKSYTCVCSGGTSTSAVTVKASNSTDAITQCELQSNAANGVCE